ncbi:MAG: hypothetical protein U0640_14390 [Phycisphaerales bacterium]
MNRLSISSSVSILSLVGVLSMLAGGCDTAPQAMVSITPPIAVAPDGIEHATSPAGDDRPAPLVLHNPGDVAWETVHATIIDTRLMQSMPEVCDVSLEQVRRVREVLPPHGKPPEVTGLTEVVPQPPIGDMMDDIRTHPEALWVGPTQTGWNPPDPSLAVGPNHIVATVN